MCAHTMKYPLGIERTPDVRVRITGTSTLTVNSVVPVNSLTQCGCRFFKIKSMALQSDVMRLRSVASLDPT